LHPRAMPVVVGLVVQRRFNPKTVPTRQSTIITSS